MHFPSLHAHSDDKHEPDYLTSFAYVASGIILAYFSASDKFLYNSELTISSYVV